MQGKEREKLLKSIAGVKKIYIYQDSQKCEAIRMGRGIDRNLIKNSSTVQMKDQIR